MDQPNYNLITDPHPEHNLQATLAQIRGVMASRIVFDEDRGVREIHIIAMNARNPKRIIRDVETLLLVKHGYRIDYRKISLVQLDEEQLAGASSLRPIIRNVTEEELDGVRKIRVEVQSGRRRFTGEAEEPIDNPTPFSAAAQATIQSVSKLIRHNGDLQLAHIGTMQFDSHRILIVVVKCFAENREDNLVGACFVGPRPLESAVRATLDALNRRFNALV